MKNRENFYGNFPIGRTFEFEGKEYTINEVGIFEKIDSEHKELCNELKLLESNEKTI